MPLDPNIILAGKPATLPSYYENQLNQSNLDTANQSRQINQINIDKANQAATNAANLKSIYAGYTGDNSDLTQKLIQSGNLKEGMDIGNFGTEQTTKDLANTQTVAKIVGQTAGSILDVPDEKIHEAASQGIDYLQQNNVYTPEFAAHAKEQISNMQPAELRDFLRQTQKHALSPEQQLPKTGIENLGGTSQPYAQSPITGMTTNAGLPMQRTQTPDQAAKAPETKEVMNGVNKDTLQWNSDTQKWNTISSGNAFKPAAENSDKPLTEVAKLNADLAAKRITQDQYDNAISKSGGMGNRAEVYFNRVVNAGNEAAAALKNVAELPLSSSTGIMGVLGNAPPANGLIGATKRYLANNMTSQEVQDYNVMVAGIQRSLGAIETAGLAVPGSLTHSMDAVIMKDGQSNMTKMRQLAEIRQIVEKGLEPNLVNPKIPQQQKQLVQGIIDQVKEAVPYTHHDITMLQQAQNKNPDMTMEDYAKQQGLIKPSQNNITPPNAYKSNIPPKDFPQAKYLPDPQGNMHWYVKGANGKAQIVTQ